MSKAYITWYATASLKIETEETAILIDPFYPLPGAAAHLKEEVFTNTNSILLTHGHLDHLASIPHILLKNKQACVYATKTPVHTLAKKGCKKDQLKKIWPGEILHVGSIKIHVLPGKHIQFDEQLVSETLHSSRMVQYAYNIPYLGAHYLSDQENNETVTYLIEAAGKSILVLGSMALQEEYDYPKNVDLLVLPYQGCSKPELAAMQIIRRIEPKKILLDHFDNSFPPLSNHIPADNLQKELINYNCRIPLLVPKSQKKILV
jgi:L-ascorbate metabolism protein UlaG (beta-lactamase superfamily)